MPALFSLGLQLGARDKAKRTPLDVARGSANSQAMMAIVRGGWQGGAHQSRCGKPRLLRSRRRRPKRTSSPVWRASPAGAPCTLLWTPQHGGCSRARMIMARRSPMITRLGTILITRRRTHGRRWSDGRPPLLPQGLPHALSTVPARLRSVRRRRSHAMCLHQR